MIHDAGRPLVDDDVPIGASTIPGILDEAARRYGDRDWLRFADVTQSFAELRNHSEAVSAALIAAGIGHDDGVASFMGNRFEWLHTQFGILGAGAWMVPLNTWCRTLELTHVLDVSRCRALVWEAEVLGQDMRPLLQSLIPEVAQGPPGRWRSARFPELELVIGIGDGPWPSGVTPWGDFVGRGETITGTERRRRREEIAPQQTCLVIFTSGTTGAPKGAILAHTGVVDHMREWTRHIGLRPDDRSIMASPLFWIFGCTMNAIVPLLAGSAVVLQERFQAERFVSDIESHACTHLQGVPAQYEMAIEHAVAQRRDLSSLHVVQIGGAKTVVTLAERIQELAPEARMLAAYGLTEAVGVNTWTEFDDSFDLLGTSIGHAAPDNEASVRHRSTFEEVPAGEVGELWLRGAHVMKGYLNAPEADREALVDGWLRTGDLVTADERGYFQLAGRSSDAYKRGGMNVYPAEAELLLATHPAVDQVALIGVPDARLGEVGAAYVVLAPGAHCSAEELLAWAQARIARYKVPAHVRFVCELPFTASGKVRKFTLREAWAAETHGA